MLKFSPNRKYMIILSHDLEARYNPNGIQIVDMESRKIVYEHNFDYFGPYNAIWAGDDTLEVEKEYLIRLNLTENRYYDQMLFKKYESKWERVYK